MMSVLFYLLIPALAVALDQLVKYLTVAYLKPVGEIPLIEGVFHLEYVENRGAAWGAMEGQMLFFYAVTAVMLVGMILALRKNWVRGVFGRTVVLLLIGGTLGNFIDRVRLGYVVDMFSFTLIDFPVFNVADIFLTCGCGALFVYLIFFDDKLQAAAKTAQQQEEQNGNDPS